MWGERSASYISCQKEASSRRKKDMIAARWRGGQEQCRGTGCNLQDVRSNGDMQPDKYNTKPLEKGRHSQPLQYPYNPCNSLTTLRIPLEYPYQTTLTIPLQYPDQTTWAITLQDKQSKRLAGCQSDKLNTTTAMQWGRPQTAPFVSWHF